MERYRDFLYLPAMYQLFGDLGTLTIGPHITLEEIGANYEFQKVEVEKQEHKTERFLSMNPAGTVPVLVHDGLVVTEAAAIMQYLAEQHEPKLVPAPGTPQRATILRWLTFTVSTLQPANRRLFYPERFSTDPTHVEGIAKQADQHQLAAWKILDEHALSEGPFILGQDYTIADIYLTMFSTWRDDPLEIRRMFPKVGRLVEAAIERPATRRVLEEHGEI